MKLHLSEPTTILKDGQLIELNQPVYNITNEKLMKENDFLQCYGCKDYFDVIHAHSKFSPKCDKQEYCQSCLP